MDTMLTLLLSTLALVGGQHYDEHYPFGQLSTPIQQILVFDCGTNPNRAIRNPKVTFNRNDLELPGTIFIQDFEIEVTKPIPRPFNGRVEAWRTIWLFGGTPSTIQIGCYPLSSFVFGTVPVGLDSLGTCDYGDLCWILDQNTPVNSNTGEETCFEEAMNLGIQEDQCTCGGIIAPKVDSIPNWNKEIDLTDLEQGLFTFIAEGDYELKLIAEDANGNEEACIGITLPVKEYEDPIDTGGGWLVTPKQILH